MAGHKAVFEREQEWSCRDDPLASAYGAMKLSNGNFKYFRSWNGGPTGKLILMGLFIFPSQFVLLFKRVVRLT